MGDGGSGLGDLSAELAQAKQANSEDSESESSTDSSETTEADTTTKVETASEEQADVAERDPREDPAFPYDATVQFPHYAREEARDEFEAARKYEAERTLEQDHGLKNVEKREMHDAALRLVADHSDLWARYVMAARGLDPDASGERDDE